MLQSFGRWNACENLLDLLTTCRFWGPKLTELWLTLYLLVVCTGICWFDPYELTLVNESLPSTCRIDFTSYSSSCSSCAASSVTSCSPSSSDSSASLCSLNLVDLMYSVSGELCLLGGPENPEWLLVWAGWIRLPCYGLSSCVNTNICRQRCNFPSYNVCIMAWHECSSYGSSVLS